MAMARMSAGNASTMSMMRMRTLSDIASREARDGPDRGADKDGQVTTAMGPTGSETREP